MLPVPPSPPASACPSCLLLPSPNSPDLGLAEAASSRHRPVGDRVASRRDIGRRSLAEAASPVPAASVAQASRQLVPGFFRYRQGGDRVAICPRRGSRRDVGRRVLPAGRVGSASSRLCPVPSPIRSAKKYTKVTLILPDQLVPEEGSRRVPAGRVGLPMPGHSFLLSFPRNEYLSPQGIPLQQWFPPLQILNRK
jgi:hypothetical protein